MGQLNGHDDEAGAVWELLRATTEALNLSQGVEGGAVPFHRLLGGGLDHSPLALFPPVPLRLSYLAFTGWPQRFNTRRILAWEHWREPLHFPNLFNCLEQ